MGNEALVHWRRHFHAMSEVRTAPPTWVIPGLLVPGLNLVVGDPKTYKSFLVLHMIASVLERLPVGEAKAGRLAMKRGPCVYFAAEQSPGSLRHIYETRVLKRKLKSAGILWDFAIPKDPWAWQIDEPDRDHNLEDFIADWKPMILVLDPLVYFHSLDENDPHLVRPLVPLRKAMMKHGGALVVVHHARKEGPQQGNQQLRQQFSGNRVRGTSALWAMADGGIENRVSVAGAVNIATSFKDHEGQTWTWRIR